MLSYLGTPPWPGYPPAGYPPQGTPPAGYPPSQGTPPARVPPWPGYPPWGGTPLARVPPLAGPGRIPPCCPMAFWEMLQSIMGYGYPPPRCGLTNKVKLLPSRRTTYAGGNNQALPYNSKQKTRMVTSLLCGLIYP